MRWFRLHEVTAVFAVLSAVAWCATIAEAHPHVFAKVRTELVVKSGALVGLRHTWVFDENWLQSQLLEHDKDGDGKLTPAELAPLEAESKSTLAMFKSFTVVRAGSSLVRVVDPRNVKVDYHGAALGLSFSVNLAKPVPLAGATALLEIYDATWFSSFAFDGPAAVTFAEPAPAGCVIATAAPSAQQLAAFKLIQRQMGPEFVDPGPPRSVSITCPAGQVVREDTKVEAIGMQSR